MSVEKALQNQQLPSSSASRMSMIIEESVRREAEKVNRDCYFKTDTFWKRSSREVPTDKQRYLDGD